MAEHKNEREQSKAPDTAGKTKGRAEFYWVRKKISTSPKPSESMIDTRHTMSFPVP